MDRDLADRLAGIAARVVASGAISANGHGNVSVRVPGSQEMYFTAGPSLRGHPKIVSMEETDIRGFEGKRLPMRPDVVVIDVSFISLKAVLPVALSLAAAPMHLLALIKPQFEAPRKHSKRGIIRDAAVHQAVCDDIAAFVGLARRGPVDLAVRVESWEDFRAQFGDRSDAFFLPDAVLGFFRNGGRTGYVVRVLHRSPSAGEQAEDAGLPATAACTALCVDTLTTGPSPTWVAAQLGVEDPGTWGNLVAVSVHFTLRAISPTPSCASGWKAGRGCPTISRTIRSTMPGPPRRRRATHRARSALPPRDGWIPSSTPSRPRAAR